jgi:hypothetical protein
VCNVGLTTIPAFIRGFVHSRVDETIVEIYGVEEGNRPEFSGKPSAIQQCSCFHSQRIVVYLRTTVLGRAVGTSGVNHITKSVQHQFPIGGAASEFATLIRMKYPIADPKFLDKCGEDVKWGFFSLCKEGPDSAGSTIDDDQM